MKYLLAVLVALALTGCAATSSGTTPGDGGPTVQRPKDTSAPARKITAREWQMIAKNPEAHKDDRIIVYGQVTQFDAATGNEGFRANVDGVQHPVEYGYADYKTNTMLVALFPDDLANVVQGDLFKAEVTVVGSISYETQIGGNTTVPALYITKIEVIGSAE